MLGKAGASDTLSGEKNKAVLVRWLRANFDHPYPTTEQKAMLAQSARMSVDQVADWFGNTRRTLKNRNPSEQSKWLQKYGIHSANSRHVKYVRQYYGEFCEECEINA